MPKINNYESRPPLRTDKLLGTDNPSGQTANFTVGELEDFMLGVKGDRKIPVEAQVDFTTAEPYGAIDDLRYINTVTGLSALTQTSVVKDYIYAFRGTEWEAIVPTEGFTLWDKQLDRNLVYTGSAWVWNAISQVDLDAAVAGVNNEISSYYTYDENGNVTGFSSALTSSVRTTVSGEGYALSSAVDTVEVNLGTLTGTFNSKVIDDAHAFAGIPHTFKQDDAPTDSDPKFIRNSVWYDTNDGNKAYVLEPQSETPNAPLVWVEATDARLGELITEVGAQKNILIDTNGHVAGMTMGNFGPDRSYISFLADRFKIYTYDENTAGGTVSNPFVVENGVVKISESATRSITIGDVPPEAQSTVVFATSSTGTNASTSKFDTDSSGNVTLTRSHVFLANTRWVDGDSVPSAWVFEKISGDDGTSVTILGTKNSQSALPSTASNGDGYLIGGDLWVWIDTQFVNVGNIQGPTGNDGVTPTFGLDYNNGIDGSFNSFIYKVSDTAPARPPSSGTNAQQGHYDGTTETIPEGWTDNPSASTQDVEWVSKAIYDNTKTVGGAPSYTETSTWTKRTSGGHAWSAPSKIFQKGDTGEDSYTVVLSNDSHTIPVDVDGVHDYAGSGSSVVVYKGTTELNGKTLGSAGAGEFVVTAVPTDITLGSPTSPGNPVFFGDASAMTQNIASIEYSVNIEGSATVIKTQTFSKVTDGAAGTPGQNGDPGPASTTPGPNGLQSISGLIYYQVATSNAPAAPVSTSTNSGISFNFSSGNFTNLDTSIWGTTTPELGPGTSTNKFYSCRYYVQENTGNTGSGTPSFTTPVAMYSFNQVVTFDAIGSPGSTIIDGGRIKTNTLSADTLSAGTIDANNVTIVNLNADNITSGSIDAEDVNITNLNADEITSGNISAERITAGKLRSTNYDASDVQGSFSEDGTEIDLTNGSIRSKNFRIESDGTAVFAGEHSVGKIGNWNVTDTGTLQDDSNKITLNPVTSEITMRESTGDLKVRMSAQTSLSSIDSGSSSFPSSSQGGYSILYNFNLTNTAQDGTNYATQNKYSAYSSSRTVYRPGAYELDPDTAGAINSTMGSLATGILEDMPVGSTNTPTSLTSTQISDLNSAGAQEWGYINGSDLAARAVVKMYIQVVEGNENNLQLVDEHLLVEKTVVGEYTRNYWLPSLFDPSGWARVQANGGGSTSTLTYSFENYPPVLNIPTGGSYRVRFRLELATRPYRTINYNSSNLNGLQSINGYQVSIPTASFVPISGAVNLLLPSNFSEISGGGVQVVTNADQYVKMPRNAVGSGASSTVLSASGGVSMFLNNQHGINAIYADGNVEVTRALDAQFLNADYLNDLDISSLGITTNIGAPGNQSSAYTRHNSIAANTKNYVVIPGGVIIQWGHIYNTGTMAVTFPLTFPNAVGSVVCSTNRNSSGNSGYNHVYSYGRSGCNLVLDSDYGFWIAIGH